MSAPTSAPDAVDHELLATEWTLDALVDGEGEAGVTQRLQQGAELAAAFAERYRGRLAELDAPQLAAAMRALGEVFDLLGRAGAYAALRFSTDTADPERGALLAAVQEKETEIQTALLFFELEWAALEESRVEELLDPANDELDFCRHHLRSARRYRHHLLSEPEEKVLSEKALTGAVAWGRLFEELISAVEVELPTAGPPNGAAPAGPALPATESPAARVDSAGATGAQGREAVALDVALSRLASPDRGVRKGAAGAITAALAPGLRTRAFIYNTLLVDKSVDDRLRRYPNWLAARNLANEVADESVQALHEAVRGRYELARRWYRLKARLLGLERLADYDRMAAVTEDEVSFPFAAGREIVLDSYTAFSPELGAVARRLFELRHIDAPVRPAKRGGAFAAAAVPSVEPHVLLNYTARRRDVLTLAHELGHAVHFSLAARQGIFHQHTPLTLSETASVFGETIVFGRLLQEDSSPSSRLALLAENIEDRIATVFRQVAMSRFEELVHTERRERGELSVERFGELWVESQREMLGDAVEVTEGYRSWWSYIPHFIETPGYVYAYAYGQLLALSVYERYEVEGEAMVPRYLELLSAGGSRSPEELGEIVGVDLADAGFWDSGLDLVERQLAAAEAAAEASGRL